MKNADLIRTLPKRTAKRAELTTTKRSLVSSGRKAEKLERELRDLDEVTEIVEGIALARSGGWIQAVGDDIKRCASIYPNAHNGGKTYGLHTYTDAFGRAGEVWHGSNLSHAQAEQLALAWVLKGTRSER